MKAACQQAAFFQVVECLFYEAIFKKNNKKCLARVKNSGEAKAWARKKVRTILFKSTH